MRAADSIDANTGGAPARGRVLASACLAHLLHDGYSSMLYLLLPFWQHELALTLTGTGLLKTLYSGAMAAGQVPAGMLGERQGEKRLLILGTFVAAIAVIALQWARVPLALALLLVLTGLGASVQHPLSSTLVSKFYAGRELRTTLGTYNFAGDLGKMALPALLTVLIAGFGWRFGTSCLGVLGLAVAALLLFALPLGGAAGAGEKSQGAPAQHPLPESLRRRSFAALSAIGLLDSATRSGLLILLPFLLLGKGAGAALVGSALTLLFAGGALGKFTCGVLAAKIGILRTVVLTEVATAGGILLLVLLPLAGAVVLMPFLGLVLNGTSSALYGTVPELAPRGREARAFGLFYTVTTAADATAPTLYGRLGDAFGLAGAGIIVAAVVLLILPLALLLRRALSDRNA